MNKLWKIFVGFALLSAGPAVATGVGEIPPTGTQTVTSIGAGVTNLLDQYLSDNSYKGLSLNFSREFTGAQKKHNGLYNYFFYSVSYALTMDHNKTSAMHHLMLHFDYANYFTCFDNKGLTILAGPGIFLDLGALDKPANSNNPFQLKTNLEVSASLQAGYKFKIKNYPMAVRYNMNLAVLGMMFAPDYGMLYYKWLLIDDKPYAGSFAWLGNSFAMINKLSVDFYTSKKVQLRLSYMASLNGYHKNHLESRINTQVISLGIILRRNYSTVSK
ncbi:MAG: DUF3316 domain-containing protein [Bacteroidaceae bacterium]|nr:DUF3316 domain-containing protein [Bacteroidaceae bacterium]